MRYLKQIFYVLKGCAKISLVFNVLEFSHLYLLRKMDSGVILYKQ